MANILLTDRCVRACPYCFAGEEMAERAGNGPISWENIVYLADFLRASGERHLSLLGGEPTLHPDFPAVLAYFAARDFNVTVFTAGIMATAKIEALIAEVPRLPAGRVQFVCNINNPAQTPETAAETEKLNTFLAAMGPLAMAGFNIYRTDFELDFLFALIERHKLKRRLRIGIAHPIPGAANLSIAAADIEGVIARLARYRPDFERLRIRPTFDCGFPLCKISDEQLGWQTRLSGPMEFKCSPAIDIAPDMTVYCCFPLSGMARKSVFDFDSFRQMVKHYRALQSCLRAVGPGLYPECGPCPHRAEGTCAAGGACQIASRLSPEQRRDIERALDAARLPA